MCPVVTFSNLEVWLAAAGGGGGGAAWQACCGACGSPKARCPAIRVSCAERNSAAAAAWLSAAHLCLTPGPPEGAHQRVLAVHLLSQRGPPRARRKDRGAHSRQRRLGRPASGVHDRAAPPAGCAWAQQRRQQQRGRRGRVDSAVRCSGSGRGRRRCSRRLGRRRGGARAAASGACGNMGAAMGAEAGAAAGAAAGAGAAGAGAAAPPLAAGAGGSPPGARRHRQGARAPAAGGRAWDGFLARRCARPQRGRGCPSARGDRGGSAGGAAAWDQDVTPAHCCLPQPTLSNPGTTARSFPRLP
jgi:hypothetical protein